MTMCTAVHLYIWFVPENPAKFDFFSTTYQKMIYDNFLKIAQGFRQVQFERIFKYYE